jgi:N-ethylmaleimide reductase
MQFLSTNTNTRTDGYGGSVQNRIRFVVETLQAMTAAAGDAAKVGIKISPAMPFNDIHDDNPIETYTTLVKAIAPMGLAYLHVLRTPPIPNIFEILRPLYSGVFAAGGAFDLASGNAALASGLADYIVFGKLHVEPRPAGTVCVRDRPTPFDAMTFYTPGAKGYTDFCRRARRARSRL